MPSSVAAPNSTQCSAPERFVRSTWAGALTARRCRSTSSKRPGESAMRGRCRVLLWMSALMGMATAAHAVAETACVEQPRPFGHVLGDVITQRVRLDVANADFTPAELPSAQRLNVWFDRRKPRIETAADGTRWLTVDYQIINTPQV